MSQTSDKLAAAADRPRRLRTVVEMGICLVALVGLFRTFLASGYMIETGSMAPCLLGYHRQVACPDCHYSFAIEGNNASTKAVCPNCGSGGIPVPKLPPNDADHIPAH